MILDILFFAYVLVTLFELTVVNNWYIIMVSTSNFHNCTIYTYKYTLQKSGRLSGIEYI